MSLFPKPSAIINRLRKVRAHFIATKVDFPDFEIYGGASQDLVEADAHQKFFGNDKPDFALYCMNGASSGTPDHAGATAAQVSSGYYIALLIKMEDHRGQQADEWTTFLRAFCVLAIHGWDPFTDPDVPGQEDVAVHNYPMTFASDTPVNIPGSAYIRRTFEFNHLVNIDRDCLDDTLGSWDDLEWFEELRAALEVGDSDTPDVGVNVDIEIT